MGRPRGGWKQVYTMCRPVTKYRAMHPVHEFSRNATYSMGRFPDNSYTILNLTSACNSFDPRRSDLSATVAIILSVSELPSNRFGSSV